MSLEYLGKKENLQSRWMDLRSHGQRQLLVEVLLEKPYLFWKDSEYRQGHQLHHRNKSGRDIPSHTFGLILPEFGGIHASRILEGALRGLLLKVHLYPFCFRLSFAISE